LERPYLARVILLCAAPISFVLRQVELGVQTRVAKSFVDLFQRCETGLAERETINLKIKERFLG
jgi:hypothetical protein